MCVFMGKDNQGEHMALVDFGTVQVYEMEDLVEVVFPYDREFSAFMNKLKGRWMPQRRAWQIKPAFIRATSSEVIEKITEQLKAQAPKSWDHNLSVLRKQGCVMHKFEIFAGLGGVRLRMPLGHPCHHHLKKIDRLSSVRDTWYIPAAKFSEKAVQEAVARIIQDDRKAYIQAFDATEERCIIGKINVGEDQLEAYGLEKEAYVAVQGGFLKIADPMMASSGAREVAFEVLSMRRQDDASLKVKLEYVDPIEGYAHLSGRSFAENKLQAIGVHLKVDDDWIQKRS